MARQSKAGTGDADLEAVLTAATRELEAELARPLAAGLYLVATPIGHLADFSLRAIAVLARADHVYCEDTRHSRRLLDRYGIGRPLRVYEDHGAAKERPRIMAALAEGRSVAVISDAGTPLISDPGFKLVREAVAAGHQAIAIPGASAVLAGLTASGLPTDQFHFEGFLPPKHQARCNRLDQLSTISGTLVLFEAPQRLAEALSDAAARLGPRQAVVARELTKLHETLHRGTLDELAGHFASEPARGEIVLLIGAAPEREVDENDIRQALQQALKGQSLRDAVQAVAEQLRAPRRKVYDLAIALKDRT